MQLSLFDPSPLTHPFPHPRLRLGTASWSFPGWHPLVYANPTDAPALAKNGLAEYASHPLLRAVALDRGLYSPIPVARLQQYASQVPDDFRFLLRAPSDLVRPGSPHYFDLRLGRRVVEGALEGLGAKLSSVCFYFPPGQAREGFAARLDRFLDGLPAEAQYCCELRQGDLGDERYAEVMQRRGASHVWNVFPGMPLEPPTWGHFRVIRWTLGSPGHSPWNLREAALRYLPFSRLQDEDPVTREHLCQAIHRWLNEGCEVLVLANNKAEGCAPLTLAALAAQLAA